jgi:hypothetical protein
VRSREVQIGVDDETGRPTYFKFNYSEMPPIYLFMDKLSENAFQFELPFTFGVKDKRG